MQLRMFRQSIVCRCLRKVFCRFPVSRDDNASGLVYSAFENPDGTLAFVLLNQQEKTNTNLRYYETFFSDNHFCYPVVIGHHGV
ncbi:MAG: hypothetical protein K2L60_08740 [Bacteroides sp.]|nr:hypothetical protein [Bacteroides sp.]